MQNKNIKYLGFNDYWFLFIGIIVVSFSMPLLFFGKTLEDGFIAFLPEWGISFYFTCMYWLGTRFLLIEIRKRFPDFNDAPKRIMVQVVIAVIYALVVGRISVWIVEPYIFHRDDYHPISGVAGTYGIILFSIAIYESIYFYYHLKLTIEEKEEVRREQLKSELEGLRNQVNPHFLFNSLNTLMNIVAEDQKLAISFLKKLSKVYRYVLDSRREQLIPLSEEIEFMNSYVFLQKERFHNSLQVEMEVSDSMMKKQIVPLAMQILFENAIKHNVVSSKRPLTVKVFIEKDKLVVENNLQRKNIVMPGTQVGLENVKTRYKIFTDKKVDIKETEEVFSVALPLI